MTRVEYENIIKDYQQLGLPLDLAKQLADIHCLEAANPYYERSKNDNALFAQAHNIMNQKSVLPVTTPFIM